MRSVCLRKGGKEKGREWGNGWEERNGGRGREGGGRKKGRRQKHREKEREGGRASELERPQNLSKIPELIQCPENL